jgi:hypothetical protein
VCDLSWQWFIEICRWDEEKGASQWAVCERYDLGIFFAVWLGKFEKFIF